MKRRSAVTGLTLLLVVLLAGALVVQRRVRPVIVSGTSMEPTFHDGQKVWISDAYWLVGPIHRKDVVVLTGATEDEYIIKRVYWLEGEEVLPDHKSLDIPFFEPYTVPRGYVWVLGDNRSMSSDSREFGAVPLNRVKGKVVRY